MCSCDCAGKFFWYTLFIMLSLTFFTLYGILAVSITPNAGMATVLTSATNAFWFLFAGFVIPKPVRHALHAMIQAELEMHHERSSAMSA